MDPFDLHQCPSFSALLKKAGFQGPVIIDQVVIDSRRIHSKHSLFVALPGSYDGHHFIANAASNGARYALVRPGYVLPDPSIDITLLPTEAPLAIFQELAACYRRSLIHTNVVAIAGSFGKTMLKDLLWSILKIKFPTAASPDSFNSQIGVPLSLFTVNQSHKIALIEAAVSHPGEMDALQRMIDPAHGIITHLGKKHLHTMGDVATNVQEIIKLFKGLQPHAWLLHPLNQILNAYTVKMKAETIPWNEFLPSLPHAVTRDIHSEVHPGYTIEFPDGHPFHSTIKNEHHYFSDLVNIAVKAAWLLGADRQMIVETLQRYTPEPNRTEIWQSSLGTTFINDTQCGDPSSIDASLQTLHQAAGSGRKIFVFSGLRSSHAPTELDYRRVGQALARQPIDKLFLVGDFPHTPLYEEIEKQSKRMQITACEDHESAIDLLRLEARHDDFILLKGSKKLPFDALASAFADASCSNLCIINLAAIEWNLHALKRHQPPKTRQMVMVKAHAYGSDSVRMARYLSGCGIDILGLSYVDEAVVLRRSGIKVSLFVINASPNEASKLVKWNLEAGVSTPAAISSIGDEASRQSKPVKLHLHVDTGMSRFGCRPENALNLARQISEHPYLHLEGIMTHFACAENPSQDAFTLQQIDKFYSVVTQLQSHDIHPQWIHASNSAAAIRFSLPFCNMVRIGLAAWGLHSSETTHHGLELKLALSLISHIEEINDCKKGDTVSYGRTYTVEKEHQAIAVLPIGYFDGLHRHYSGKAHVMIRGQKAPMVGTICMDYMMVDVSDVPHVRVGDPVLIFGTDQYGQYVSPEGFAQCGNSIAHELITCLGPRIPRVFIHEEAL